MPSDNLELKAVDLACERNDLALFNHLSFSVAPGQLLKITGHNGSGKTSLLRILCGLRMPDEGSVQWCGHCIRKNRIEFLTDMAYVGHQHGIKNDLTASENLRLTNLAGSRNQKFSIPDVLKRFNLEQHEDVLARNLSAGQKQRLALARLLLNNARLWILDEPFTAVDLHGRENFEHEMAAHLANGGMVVMSSHHPLSGTINNVVSLELGRDNNATG